MKATVIMMASRREQEVRSIWVGMRWGTSLAEGDSRLYLSNAQTLWEARCVHNSHSAQPNPVGSVL